MFSLQNVSRWHVFISGIVTIIFGVVWGWWAFPMIVRLQIATKINLRKGSEFRELWSAYPYPAEVRVYFFNVTNPTEVQNGGRPALKEVGPYVYRKYKYREKQQDHEEDDTLSFNLREMWFFEKNKSSPLTGEEIITLPHLLILSIMLTIEKDMPALVPLAARALPRIFGPSASHSVFMQAAAHELLFEGRIFNCSLADFSAKIICLIARARGKDLQKVGSTAFSFSFFGKRNGTLLDRERVKRGLQDSRTKGRIVEYKGLPKMSVWNEMQCNEYDGTDGTIFPPFIETGVTLKTFQPDLCRTVKLFFLRSTVYMGIKSNVYYATFGDASSDPELKCFCTTPRSCPKAGVHDLTLCKGVSLAVSFPHFYMADDAYLNGVLGLQPKQSLHETTVYVEQISGMSLLGYTRVQFNTALRSLSRFEPMRRLRPVMLPLFWFEEELRLHQDQLDELKQSLMLLSVGNASKWVIILLGAGLTGLGFFLLVQRATQRLIVFLGRVSPDPLQESLDSPEPPSGLLSQKSV